MRPVPVQIIVALAVLAATLGPVFDAGAAPLEKPVANGYFFTQTAGRDGSSGFRVTDEGGVRFWSEFQRLGGVAALGYPVSRRFEKDGFVVQAMQKGVLQWRPDVGKAWLTNVFDEMHHSGKDKFLADVRQTPAPLPDDWDKGKSWQQTVATRLALLDSHPAIRDRYFSVADPMTFFGLPTSPVTDQGNHYAIRLQRAVIQQWKQDVPWAKAGETTVANGADIAKEAGLFPGAAVQAESADGAAEQAARPEPAPRGGERPAPAAAAAAPASAAPASASATQQAVDRLNHYRALMGIAPIKADPALEKAAMGHAAYYRLNFAGMAGMGLHKQSPGAPGFTGEDWTARARAAGYRGTVDENVGLAASPARVVDAFVDTVNHRWNMLHPSAVHIGYGIDSAKPIDVMNIGFDRGAGATDKPAVYPGPNQGGVPTGSHIWETPDPAPGLPRPLGYPITATFALRANVEWGQPSLVDDAGQPVPHAVTTKSWLKGQSIIPHRPLKAGATYRATVRGKVDGKPFEYGWSFTTA
jgi:uncharacterized protein YkwD